MWANAGTSIGGGTPPKKSYAPGAISSPSAAGSSAWHPTVLYLLGLCIAEIVVVGFVSRRLLE